MTPAHFLKVQLVIELLKIFSVRIITFKSMTPGVFENPNEAPLNQAPVTAASKR